MVEEVFQKINFCEVSQKEEKLANRRRKTAS